MAKVIFILEDNDDLRELYSLILEQEDYKIKAFATVAEFKEHFSQIPDLYLLDVMLPDGNGIQLYKELKNSPANAKVPIVMVSANANVGEVKLECPNAEFIAKPFDIDNLSNRIAAMFNFH